MDEKTMKNLFSKDIIYEDDIINCICEAYDLVITDCLKDDNEITVALDEEGDPVWVFSLVEGNYLTFDRTFRLVWQDDELLSTIEL